jgi:hypothetical protein
MKPVRSTAQPAFPVNGLLGADSLRELEPPHRRRHRALSTAGTTAPTGRQAALLLGWSGTVEGHRRGRIAVAIPDGSGWTSVDMWDEQEMFNPA